MSFNGSESFFRATYKIMLRILAIICSIAVLWLFSMVLGGQVAYNQVDDKLGITIPVPGSSIARFTEGGAVSHYGVCGLNPVVLEKWDGKSTRIMLYGDSYVEAFQVQDDEKPDAVLTKYLGDNAVAFGIGVSGFGLPSMIARATAYEKVMGKPVLNVFFCASGIRNDVLADTTAQKTLPIGYVEKVTRGKNTLKINIVRIINRFYLNFVPVIWKKLSGICKSSHAPQTVCLEDSGSETESLRDELSYILRSMKELQGDSVIVYCPELPKIKNGNILTNDMDESDVVILKGMAEKFSVPIIDVTPVLLEFYRENNRFPRGFDNLGGPGNGHLTPSGIEAIFKYLALELKKCYGL